MKEALLALVEPTRKEPGCLCYNLHQSKADPTQFMFYEQWASKEALDAHGKTPHMKALGGSSRTRPIKAAGSSCTSCWAKISVSPCVYEVFRKTSNTAAAYR